MKDGAADVAVFIDWQNTYMAARRAFGLTRASNSHGSYSPLQLATHLARGRHLVLVEVHRGIPSRHRDQRSYAATMRQAAVWRREGPRVVVARLRPLQYRRDGVALEKGVDVALAVSAFEASVTGLCDVAVVFSHDTDLLPAVEAIARLRGPEAVETAAWHSRPHHTRLRPRAAVRHHQLPRAVFDRVHTPVNYARPRR